MSEQPETSKLSKQVKSRDKDIDVKSVSLAATNEDSLSFHQDSSLLTCRDNAQFGGSRNEYRGDVDLSRGKKTIGDNAHYAHIGDSNTTTVIAENINLYSDNQNATSLLRANMELKHEAQHSLDDLWKLLRSHLESKAMEFCGEVDRFRKGKIKIADLQISSEVPVAEEPQQRKDMAKIFRKPHLDNIPYEKLFEEIKARVRGIDVFDKGYTKEAAAKFLQKHSNLVVLSGQPGIGKSTLTKRIIYEMWKFSLFEPDIVFFIQFRYSDYNRKADLLSFLAPQAEDFLSEEDRRKLLEKVQKCDNVYIIMDGLDEANFNPKMNPFTPCSIFSINTAEGFIQNLIAGNILQHCKKLITSRPYRIAQLHIDFQPRFLLNIQGLDEDGFKQICSNICGENHVRQKKILRYLRAHPDIKSFCQTPVICIMVMESLHKMYAEAEMKGVDLSKNNPINTLTSIFVDALTQWLLKKTHPNPVCFKHLCSFAFEKFDENQFYFTDFELREAKVEGQYITTFLNTILKDTSAKEMYFIHLMWQEFLAAVKLRLYTEKQVFCSTTDHENSIFFKLSSKKYETVTTKFLFGLCNDKILKIFLRAVEIEVGLSDKTNRLGCKQMLQKFVIEKLQKLAELWSDGASNNSAKISGAINDSSEIDDIDYDSSGYTSNYGVDASEDDGDNSDSDHDDVDYDSSDDGSDIDDVAKTYFSSILPILGWVYEMGDNDFTDEVAGCLMNKISIVNEQILPSDIPVINYIFRARTAKLSLNLSNPRFVGNCSQYFFTELHKTLNRNQKTQIKKLSFKGVRIQEEKDPVCHFVLSCCISQVEELFLENCEISDAILHLLFQKIDNRKKLIKLFHLNGIQNIGADRVAFLQHCSKIEQLILNGHECFPRRWADDELLDKLVETIAMNIRRYGDSINP